MVSLALTQLRENNALFRTDNLAVLIIFRATHKTKHALLLNPLSILNYPLKYEHMAEWIGDLPGSNDFTFSHTGMSLLKRYQNI